MEKNTHKHMSHPHERAGEIISRLEIIMFNEMMLIIMEVMDFPSDSVHNTVKRLA